MEAWQFERMASGAQPILRLVRLALIVWIVSMIVETYSTISFEIERSSPPVFKAIKVKP